MCMRITTFTLSVRESQNCASQRSWCRLSEYRINNLDALRWHIFRFWPGIPMPERLIRLFSSFLVGALFASGPNGEEIEASDSDALTAFPKSGSMSCVVWFADKLYYQIFVFHIMIQVHPGFMFSKMAEVTLLAATYCTPLFDILKRKWWNVWYIMNVCKFSRATSYSSIILHCFMVVLCKVYEWEMKSQIWQESAFQSMCNTDMEIKVGNIWYEG